MTSEEESLSEEDSIIDEKSDPEDGNNDKIINDLEIFINKTTAIPLDLVMKQFTLRVTACNSETGKKSFQSLVTSPPQVDNFIFSWREKILVNSLDEKSVIFFEFLEQNSGNLYSTRYFCDTEWIYLSWAVLSHVKEYDKVLLQMNKFRKRVQSSNVFFHWKKWSTKPVADTKLEISTKNFIHNGNILSNYDDIGYQNLIEDNDFSKTFTLKDNVEIANFHPYKSILGVVLKDSPEVIKVIGLGDEERASMELKGHEDIITSFQWFSRKTHEYDLLLSLSKDRSIMVWEILSNSYSLKHVIPHPDLPTSASVIWTTNGIDSYMLVTSCVDGGLRVWSYNSEGLRFTTELSGPDSEPSINIFPTSKTSFLSVDKAGSAFEWKRKAKTNAWKGKRRYSISDTIIGDLFFSKIYNLGFVLTSKGLKVFDASTGKSNSSIENIVSLENVDQIYVEDEGSYLFYIVLNEDTSTLKYYCFKDKSTKVLSPDIGIDGITSMSFHSKLGLLALVSESRTLRFFKVTDEGKKRRSWTQKSSNQRKSISNMDSILNDLHSYICGDSDVPLNRFPVEDYEPPQDIDENTFSISNQEEERDDRTFSVSSKEGGRTYSISGNSHES
ncbi:TBL3.2 family protein [Megaselia abdita]